MTNLTDGVETDPSVCYRHPGRQSWVLCQRCGRTICPECQILAPVGVHCPECVRETSGAVQWRAASPQRPPRPARRLPRVGRRGSLLMARMDGAVFTWVILGAAVLLWIVSFFTSAPAVALDGDPFVAWQLWRFLTNPLVPSASVIGFLLNGVFWVLNSPSLERMFGRTHYLTVVTSATVLGTAFSILSGTGAATLIAPLFGLFGALLTTVWDNRQMRTQILFMLAINLVLNIVLGGAASLPLLFGGILAGAGATWALRNGAPRGWRRSTVLIWGGCALFAALAVGRSLLTFGFVLWP